MKPVTASLLSTFARENGTVTNPTNWADWLKAQSAPITNPQTRRYLLSRYWYGSSGHGELRKEHFERWGYCLDVSGNSSGIGLSAAVASLADAQLATPVTDNGKLLKLALSNPDKYRIGGWLGQGYPSPTDLPSGYIQGSDGGNYWNPLASDSAMQSVVDESLGGIKRLKQAGLKFAILYHGGESGLRVPELTDQLFGSIPEITTAKGARSWPDFISFRKGLQTKKIYEEVKTIAPERQVYVFYPADDRPYNYIPGNDLYSYDYQYMKDVTDIPSSSNYFYEFNNAIAVRKTQPSIPYSNYYDLATNTLNAISSQTYIHNQPYSYDFVCPLGWYKDSTISKESIDPARLSHPTDATGYMKFSCMVGALGFVDGYFGADCNPEFGSYRAFDPTSPPPWMINTILVAEEHARFSYLDDYIFDGDLLPGNKLNTIKTYAPSYEFIAKKIFKGFVARDLNTRILARKLKGSNKYLLFLWSIEAATHFTIVDFLPGLPVLELEARRKGSLYTVDLTGSVPVVQWIDPPLPNTVDNPVLLEASAQNPTTINLLFYSIRTLDESKQPAISDFTVPGNTVTSIKIEHYNELQDRVVLTLANRLQAGTVSISYSGSTLQDTETNRVPAFTTTAEVFLQIFADLIAGISFVNNVYSAIAPTNWATTTMVSDLSLLGDGEVYCELAGSALISLSTESTNTGSYQSWAYSVSSAVVNSVDIYGAYQGGNIVNIGPASDRFLTIGSDVMVRLSRTAGVVKLSKKTKAGATWTDVVTFSGTNTQPLYVHGTIGEPDGKIIGLTVIGFNQRSEEPMQA